jgi:hypothetical protein
LSKLENIISYAKEAFEVHRDVELVSVEAEMLITLLRCSKYMKAGVVSTGVITNEFNMYREAQERWKTIQVGRVMSRLGFRAKRSSEGRAGWSLDKVLMKRLTSRYGVTDVVVQGKMV